MPSAQALAAEVIDRRMVGNLLMIELEKYLPTLPPSETVRIRSLMKEWRQISGAR